MIRDVSRLTKHKYDLLVVGGGINGAAIANLASACGASVALLEKKDFASGTSSKSTKLLHGGIRYLENLEFDLVCESLRERYVQWQAAPHLVKPLPFVIPVYAKDARPLWLMRAGVWLYDLLGGKYRIGRHRVLSVEEVTALAPGINRDGLVGAVEYFDAQMDDARLVLENVLMADQRGAHAANYVEVQDFIKDNGLARGVRAKDTLSGQGMDIFAAKIIVAAGPWSDGLIHKDAPGARNRLRLTKGVHIVYRGQIAPSAFLIQAVQERRIFFVIPFKGNSLIGTTDTDYAKGLDEVSVEEADIQYLLREASRVFPHIAFDRSKIITTFAGLRPLVAGEGHPSQVSRKHTIERSDAGIYFVMGGKYTTYRAMAEEAVKKALPHLADQLPYRGQYTLYGSGGANEELKILGQRFKVPAELIRYLLGLYGGKFMDVLRLMEGDPMLKEKICACSPAIRAQVVYARGVEMAQTVEDIVDRRLGLATLECPTRLCRRAIEEILRGRP